MAGNVRGGYLEPLGTTSSNQWNINSYTIWTCKLKFNEAVRQAVNQLVVSQVVQSAHSCSKSVQYVSDSTILRQVIMRYIGVGQFWQRL